MKSGETLKREENNDATLETLVGTMAIKHKNK
jgi:hypothetical protein